MDDDISFGLHFNIVDGHPALGTKHGSLVDHECRFWPSHRQRIAALLWRLDPDSIADELRAQLTILQNANVRVSHVDSHGHLHKFPSVVSAMIPVLKEFGVSKIRRPQNIYSKRALTDIVDSYCGWMFPTNVSTADYYYAIEPKFQDWFEKLPNLLRPGVTEMSVHPGQNEQWRRSEFFPFESRKPADMGAFGIELASYHELN